MSLELEAGSRAEADADHAAAHVVIGWRLRTGTLDSKRLSLRFRYPSKSRGDGRRAVVVPSEGQPVRVQSRKLTDRWSISCSAAELGVSYV